MVLLRRKRDEMETAAAADGKVQLLGQGATPEVCRKKEISQSSNGGFPLHLKSILGNKMFHLVAFISQIFKFRPYAVTEKLG